MASVQTTMTESNSKRRKASEEKEDRISSLPDDVLNYILSYLPIKTIVSTGRLSHRWQHLWKHLHVLDFDEYDDSYSSGNGIEQLRRFVVLVNNVLHRNRRGIRKMRLTCAHSLVNDNDFRSHTVDTWVRVVIGPNLEELDLDLLHEDDDGPDFKLPLSLFTCPNLVSLSIRSGIHLNIQSSTTICLPSLKILLIDIFGYVEVPMVNALLCGCPNIEALDLKFLTNSLDNVCLPPTLKRLKIEIESKEVGPSLEINAPDLEYIHIYQYSFSDVLNMKNLHHVIEANLDLVPLTYDFVVPLLKLLNNLSRTKHLVLNDSTTKWLLGEPRDLLFQEFCYLLHLDLTLPWFNSNSLLSLLHKCPILQVLKIRNVKEESPILGWAPQLSAPNCLVSHLTFIQFKGFRGFSDEISFVEDVLQKGLVLKTVIIADISLDQGKKYDILKILSNVPRAAEMCQLTFD